VHPSEFLQRQGTWHFDLGSAVIGALLAWTLAGVAYAYRAAIREQIEQAWAPIAAWRRRSLASQEDKYARALKKALEPLLLYTPSEPAWIFVSPSYRSLAPLPKSIAEVAQSPRTVEIPHLSLLEGHRKLVITGALGTGRTTSLVMAVWQVTHSLEEEVQEPYARIPVWVDLTDFPTRERKAKETALDHLAGLAARFLPDLVDKWLVRHLKSEPSLILLDNWDALNETQRSEVAMWIAEADELLTDAFWVVAGSPFGYGALVEAGFVAAEVQPSTDKAALPRLYRSWARLRGAGVDGDPDEDTLAALAQAIDDGAPWWEIHTRILLHLVTPSLPARPVEVFAELLDAWLAAVDLGRGGDEVSEEARAFAADILVELAASQRLEGRSDGFTKAEIREAVEAELPPKPERQRRLYGAVQRLVAESGVIRQVGKRWVTANGLWLDYLAAVRLAEEPSGAETVRQHLDDASWTTVSEFYAGLTDAEDLATDVVTIAEIEGDRGILLKAARWAAVTEPSLPWRKMVIKTLAQTFLTPDVDTELRLRIGKALARVAGPGARAFFLQALKHSAIEIRGAALRGLAWSGSSRDMRILAAALRDTDPHVQRSGVTALAEMGTAGAVTLLGDSLPDADETLMLAIAGALASLPDGGGMLDELTLHPDLMVRRAAAIGLGQIEGSWAQEKLLEIAREDMEWLVRSAAESALLEQEKQAGSATVITPQPKPDELEWLMAWAARQGLGLGVGEAALETLSQAAQQGNVDDKMLSALTLAHIGRKSDLLALELLAGDLDRNVQEAARWASTLIRRRYHFADVTLPNAEPAPQD